MFWRFFLWLTPNLCCSSVITKPKLLNITSSFISECVPIIQSISLFFNCFIILFLSDFFVDDVNNFIFKGFRISYLTDKKEDGIKISFKGQTENEKINQLFYVSNSDFQNESDISWY